MLAWPAACCVDACGVARRLDLAVRAFHCMQCVSVCLCPRLCQCLFLCALGATAGMPEYHAAVPFANSRDSVVKGSDVTLAARIIASCSRRRRTKLRACGASTRRRTWSLTEATTTQCGMWLGPLSVRTGAD